MSGYSEAVDCPRCGSIETLERSADRDDVSGCCLVCGYSYQTVYSAVSLDEINKEREELGMELLIELRPPVEGWTDES